MGEKTAAPADAQSAEALSTWSSVRDYARGSLAQKASLLGASSGDVLDAEEFAATLDVDEALRRAEEVIRVHEHDPNFSSGAMMRLQAAAGRPELLRGPDADADLVAALKTEVALVTNNSPYAEVRAVVGNRDDASTPASTVRAWAIGMLFVVVLSFVNQLFSVRQPSIRLDPPVVQLLSFPLGKAWERWMPAREFVLFGTRHRLNPGRFNQKEHMLISIMANVAKALPHSRYLIFTTWLEKYFNLPFASSFAFQITLALSMNLMGFGLAGLARRFLVYPSFCIWPRSLATVALNQSLHNEDNPQVQGPFRRLYGISRYRFFLLAFGAMFFWFWVPNYFLSAVSLFNWLAWISPTNFNLTAITGLRKGLGFNPFPTMDWNVVTHNVEPLLVPPHVTLNMCLGALLGGVTIVAMYWSNTFYTGYLPINTNTMFAHNATTYNVSAILDENGILDEAKYQAYSPVYIAASSVTYYIFFFAVYTSVISYAALYHWNDISMGFRSLRNSFRRGGKEDGSKDIHTRLMDAYREVPEWWYLILNAAAIVLGVVAVAVWPTHTAVGVVFFGIALALIFTIPTGIIFATTGIEIEYNVLAEFIGGAWQPGNALAMNLFKGFGYVTVAHALDFANDLKLGHYLKIPPRQTFWCQICAAVVSAFVCTGVMNFQILHIPDICEADQKDKFSCPGLQSYFTAAVLFGSLGARKVWGAGAQYVAMLAAFPVGLVLPLLYYYATRGLPKNHWLNKVHPVLILSGGITWSPYNLGYMWPAVFPSWLSWVYIRRRYFSLWSKYNYVLSAALSTAVAVAAVVIFFALSYHGVNLDWVGNKPDSGCEAKACTRLKLPTGEYFGPRIGTYV
ncbi:hypothetical protein CDD83_8716 [Cordyceps sp. RAO-2017]|nr:hypothetical protein CDD83_8716 [Cordyceps sp. RAO-2017]